ncbi:MAG: GumC family protein [Cyanobacteria bacterium P01_D01_bin.56]
MNFIRNVIDLNLQYLFAATRRGIVPASTAFILTVLGAATVAKMLKPTYLAQGKLLFKPDRAASLTGLEEEGGPLQSIGYGTQINSEIEIITSQPLLQKTIDILQLKDDEGQALKIEDLMINLGVSVIFQTDVLSFSYLDQDAVKAADIVNTLMELYRSEKLASNQTDTESAGDFLDRQLPISAEKVREAEYALRVFRETYNVVDLAEERALAVGALDNYRVELDAMKATLGGLYSEQESLQDEVGLSVSDAIRSNTLSQSGQVQGILDELNAVRREIAVQRVEFTEESPVLRQLLEQEAALTAHLSESAQAFGGQAVQESLLQVGGGASGGAAAGGGGGATGTTGGGASLRSLLVERYVTNQLDIISFEGRFKSIEENARVYQERVNLFPELEQRQRDLARNLEAAQETYQELLNRRQELQVKENQSTNFIQIIEPAIPPEKPSSQVAVKVIAMGIVAGFALALAIIVAIDFFIVDINGINKDFDPDTYDLPSGL